MAKRSTWPRSADSRSAAARMLSRTLLASGSAICRPFAGPVLGPFGCRSEALAAEVAWLEANWLSPAEQARL